MPVARMKLNLFLSNFIVDLGFGCFQLLLSEAIVVIKVKAQQKAKPQQDIEFGSRLVKCRVAGVGNDK